MLGNPHTLFESMNAEDKQTNKQTREDNSRGRERLW